MLINLTPAPAPVDAASAIAAGVALVAAAISCSACSKCLNATEGCFRSRLMSLSIDRSCFHMVFEESLFRIVVELAQLAKRQNVEQHLMHLNAH